MEEEDNKIYRIQFSGENRLYEIYAKHVTESDMFGFLMVEEIIFGENSSVVVDPAEEKLKTEFSNVKRTFIPMHNVLRIDEVDKTGQSKIRELGGGAKNNVSQFPNQIYTPPKSQET